MQAQLLEAEFFAPWPIRSALTREVGEGERNVQGLQETLGVAQPLVPQCLAIVRGKTIVTPRELGMTVRYALSDPLVTTLLSVTRAIFNNHLVVTKAMLPQLRREVRRRTDRTPPLSLADAKRP